MNEKIDPKDCRSHCFHPHPTDVSKVVCYYCGTEQGGKPAEEPTP